ncbi:MAG: hypothetical protein HY749_16265 [Gammaproteobacteria bacterium]|nr:hypothetical protein [Gammaproteobacteria bacterium]
MAKTGQDDTFYCNNPRTLRYTIADEEVGGALDLTGLAPKWALVRLKSDGTYDATPVLQKVLNSGITIVSVVDGQLNVQIDPVDTRDLAPGKYYHELEIFDNTGNGIVAATGTLTLLRNVTNT